MIIKKKINAKLFIFGLILFLLTYNGFFSSLTLNVDPDDFVGKIIDRNNCAYETHGFLFYWNEFVTIFFFFLNLFTFLRAVKNGSIICLNIIKRRAKLWHEKSRMLKTC